MFSVFLWFEEGFNLMSYIINFKLLLMVVIVGIGKCMIFYRVLYRVRKNFFLMLLFFDIIYFRFILLL